MSALRSPCSGSVAVPVKLTVSPGLKTLPSAGAVIITLGAPLTVIETCALSDLLPASVIGRGDGVGAGWSVLTLRLAPVPSAPSRCEVHAMSALRSPCSGSVAVPVKTTASPGSKTVSAAGAVIDDARGAVDGDGDCACCRTCRRRR